MAFAPIALTIPQYDDLSLANWWLKAYEQGTTTPLAMATDATGGTTAARYQLDSEGFPITAGNARLIPFIDGQYDLWCFPTAAEADANDTTNAIQFADNLNADPLSNPSTEPDAADDLRYGPVFTSVSAATGIDPTAIDGRVVDLIGGMVFTTVYHTSLVGCGGSSYRVVAPQALGPGDIQLANGNVGLLLPTDVTDGREYGMLYDGVTDDLVALQAAVDSGRPIVMDRESFYISENIDIASGANIDGNNATVIWKGLVDIGNNGRTKGVFTGTGVEAGNPDAVLTVLNVGDNSFDVVDGSLYAENEWIYLNGSTVGDNDTGVFPNVSVMTQITGVSTNTITIDYAVAFEFALGTTTIDKVTPVTDINIRNLHLDDQQIVAGSSTTLDRNKAICMIALNFCQNVKLSQLTAESAKFPVLMLNKCSDIEYELIASINPDWVGGGEGYVVQNGSCIRSHGKSIRGANTRHCVDFTAGGYNSVTDSNDTSTGVSSFHCHGAFEHDITFTRCIGDESQLATSGVSFGKHTTQITYEDCTLNEIGGFSHDVTIIGGTIAKLGTIQFGRLVASNADFLSQGVLARDSRLVGYTPADNLNSLEMNGGVMRWQSGSTQFGGLDLVEINSMRLYSEPVSGVIQMTVANCSEFRARSVFEELGIDFVGSLRVINLDDSEFRVSDPQGGVLLTKDLFTESEVFYSSINTRFLLRYDDTTVGSTIRPFLYQNNGESATTMYFSLAYQVIDNTTKAGTVTTGGGFTQSTLPVLEHLSNGAIATVVS